jgi:hypothetical protein
MALSYIWSQEVVSISTLMPVFSSNCFARCSDVVRRRRVGHAVERQPWVGAPASDQKSAMAGVPATSPIARAIALALAFKRIEFSSQFYPTA